MSDNKPSVQVLDNLAEQMQIPPKPELLSALRAELGKYEKDQSKIAELIRQDVAMSAAVIRVVNSAYFSFQNEIISIEHALSLMGAVPTINLVSSFLLRQALEKYTISFPRFWDTATYVAELSAYIAKELRYEESDEAYLIGLFHDAGIPLMANICANYKKVLDIANHSECIFTQAEDEEFGVNHAEIGSLICTEWGVPIHIGLAIRYHHDPEKVINGNISADPRTAKLLAILKLAEYAHEIFRSGKPTNEWLQNEDLIIGFLGLDSSEVPELVERMKGVLESEQSDPEYNGNL